MNAYDGGSWKTVVHRWQKEKSYVSVCRWTIFELGTRVIQLQCPRLQGKAYFHFIIGYHFKGIHM